VTRPWAVRCPRGSPSAWIAERVERSRCGASGAFLERWARTLPGMEHFRAAERAFVAALTMGDADRSDFAGRLWDSDFTDPAAATLFSVAMDVDSPVAASELPVVLQRRGLLRQDGYPLSEFLDWLPRLPVPVHPEAWATLIVAGTLGRQVNACGERLLQAADAGRDGVWPPGKVLALAAAQRAGLASAWRRWLELPAHWRDTVPHRLQESPERSRQPGIDIEPGELERRAGRERVLLAGLVEAPQLLGRIPWLREEDFADRACGRVYATVRRVHERGGHVDGITLPALCDDGPIGWSGHSALDVARELRPDAAVPTTVPFLSRMVLSDALLERVERTGRELLSIAEAPAAAGGLGAGMLTAAQERLDALRPWGVRWEQALQRHRTLDLTRPGLDRSRALERSSALERRAPAERSTVPGPWSGLDRDAG
jgi:hypothetical protein